MDTPPSGLAPRICCLDLDTFFVSVERLFQPELIGQPVVVGALPGTRGVVTAASYEVRVFGVRSGMPIAEAYRLAPNAIYVAGRHGEYGKYSAKVKEILERFTPIVRIASIDEFFLDFSHCEAMYRRREDADDDATIERVVRELRATIQSELGLPASAGIATTRPIAKIASGAAKPANVVLVRSGAEHAFIAPLAVRRWPGIGPVAEARLLAAGIKTLGQLLAVPANSPEATLADSVRQAVFPPHAPDLGRDRPAFREHDPEGLTVGSISNETTFEHDVGDRAVIHDRLRALAERVAWRARRRQVAARTVSLKLRYANFETLTRAKTIAATNAEATVFACVEKLFQAVYDSRRRVRLLGVALTNLSEDRSQPELPFGNDQKPKVTKAIDAVRERFGFGAIRFGLEKDRGRDPGE